MSTGETVSVIVVVALILRGGCCRLGYLPATAKALGLDDPLFPATKVLVGASHRFEVAGLDRRHWSNAGPIRKVFREAFGSAGLRYFNPLLPAILQFCNFCKRR